MEKKVLQTYLYDFYGELLTQHQRNIYEAFVLEDLSLTEIAQEQGISRQGVHDLVKRCDRILMDYEEKLHLLERFQKIKAKIAEIYRLTGEEETQPGQEPKVCQKRQKLGQEPKACQERQKPEEAALSKDEVWSRIRQLAGDILEEL